MHALQIYAEDPTICAQLGGYSTLHFHYATEVPTDRQITMRTFGFLTLMCLNNIPMAPFPLSPLFLQLVILGRSSFLIDSGLLEVVAPEALETLKPWVEWDGEGKLAEVATYKTSLGKLLMASDVQVCPPMFMDPYYTKQHVTD